MGGPRPDVLRRWVPHGFDAALVVGVVIAVGGDGEGRGPDDHTADAPPVMFLRGGSLFLPSVDRRGPVDGYGLNGGDKK